jgi:AcrR family transcriptional regulator
VATRATEPKRRRRRPEEAEREILDAAERLLRRLPAHEVTVGRIMGETTLSRKSFYVYFRDRYELITRLVSGLRAEGDAAMEPFLREGSDPVTDGRRALLGVARVYAEHGELLRALAEASTRDPEAERAWRGFVEPVRRAITERVREEIAAGRIRRTDPEPTVRALISMNLSCFFQQLVGHPEADIEALVDTLHDIWLRAMYGELPQEVASARSGRP